MKVYLAGPMRGYPNWNFEAFDEAEKRWKEAGHWPISPAAMDRAVGFSPKETDGSDIEHLKYAMTVDVAALYFADAIALLTGWEGSRGATVELALAQFLGLPVYCAEAMAPIEVDSCPWQEIEYLIDPSK